MLHNGIRLLLMQLPPSSNRRTPLAWHKDKLDSTQNQFDIRYAEAQHKMSLEKVSVRPYVTLA